MIDSIPRPHYESDEDHSEYSPSGSKRWISCPASVRFLRTIKKLPEKINAYAEEGTAAHELAAYCLENEISPVKCIGKVFNKHKVDMEMAKQVSKYVDYVNGITTWESTIWVESRLDITNIQESMFGTADAIVVSNDSIEVIDLKYGKGVIVDVNENTQLLVYAVGVLTHLSKHGLRFKDDQLVKVTIVQPRAPHEDGPIRSKEYTVAQIRDFKKKAIEAVRISTLPDAPFGPNEEVCRWCEGAPTCRAFADYNLELAKLEFADLVEPPIVFKKRLPKIEELTEQDLANIMKHAKSIEQWINAVVERALELLKNDHEVPGYKLVYGRSNRAWSCESDVFKILKEYGTDEDRLYTKKFLSPAQAEKELTDDEWKLVSSLVFKPTGKLTIAPEHDGRPKIDPHSAAIEAWTNEDI